MRIRIKNVILKTPVVKVFELALLLGAGAVYAGSYAAAAHASQILAAIACVIGVLIVTGTLRAGSDDL